MANNKKDLKIKIKHLVQYLNTLDQETEVHLDKDGWLEDTTDAENEVDLIIKRGLFDEFEDCL